MTSHYEHPGSHPAVNSAGPPPIPIVEPTKHDDDEPLYLGALGGLVGAFALTAWACVVPVVIVVWRALL